MANIRRNRVLAGWRFSEADESARGLVLAALNQIGAIRPTWQDGQPSGLGNPKVCESCGEEFVAFFGPATDRIGGTNRKFCSFSCLRAKYVNKLNDQEFKKRNQARAAAQQERLRQSMPPKTCEHCGNEFRPLPERYGQAEQRWCSQECYRADNVGRKAEPKPCAHCGEIFLSKYYGPQAEKQIFCSRKCWSAVNGNPPRPCEHCSEIFKPVRGPQGRKQRFCSRRCYDANRGGKDFVPAFACEPCD